MGPKSGVDIWRSGKNVVPGGKWIPDCQPID